MRPQREAHARKLPVLAHPSNLAGLEVSLGAGVDVLAHAIEDTRGMTDAHYARMKSQNMAMIPTLYLFRDRWMWDILDEVRTFARQGGQILFGTDVGYLPNFDHAIEYELMAAAGLGWREILASLTVNPAGRFGDGATRGRVAAGFAADLAVLGSDPAHGVRNLGDVRYTIRAGQVIFQAPGALRSAPCRPEAAFQCGGAIRVAPGAVRLRCSEPHRTRAVKTGFSVLA